MLLFKACPRCRGDMHASGDMYGDYKECLQCGWIVDIEQSGPFKLAPAAVPAKVLAAKKRKVA